MTRSVTANDLGQIGEQINHLRGKIIDLQKQIKAIRTVDSGFDVRVVNLEADMLVAQADIATIQLDIAPLFLDPVEWFGSFNMNGNNIDLQGGELRSTAVNAEYVRFEPHYEALSVPANAASSSAIQPPAWAKIQDDGASSVGVYAWKFDKTTTEQVFFNVLMPHSWKEGTVLTPRVHWAVPKIDAGAVRWGLEYTIADTNGIFPITTSIEATDISDETILKHQIVSLPEIDMTGRKIGAIICCRLYRNPTHIDDNFPGDASFIELDFNHQTDSIGSDSQFTKSVGISSAGTSDPGTLGAPGSGGGGGGGGPIPTV